MTGTFWHAHAFTGDSLLNWNTAKVGSLASAFMDTSAFTGDGLLNWNVESLGDIAYAFKGATAFTGDGLINWNTARLTSVLDSFYGATSFTGDGTPTLECTLEMLRKTNSLEHRFEKLEHESIYVTLTYVQRCHFIYRRGYIKLEYG